MKNNKQNIIKLVLANTWSLKKKYHCPEKFQKLDLSGCLLQKPTPTKIILFSYCYLLVAYYNILNIYI